MERRSKIYRPEYTVRDIYRQDLWQHIQLKLIPSKTALYAIFQANDFNDYWDFNTLQKIL